LSWEWKIIPNVTKMKALTIKRRRGSIFLRFKYAGTMIQAPRATDTKIKDVSIRGLSIKWLPDKDPIDSKIGRLMQCIAQSTVADIPKIAALFFVNIFITANVRICNNVSKTKLIVFIKSNHTKILFSNGTT